MKQTAEISRGTFSMLFGVYAGIVFFKTRTFQPLPLFLDAPGPSITWPQVFWI